MCTSCSSWYEAIYFKKPAIQQINGLACWLSFHTTTTCSNLYHIRNKTESNKTCLTVCYNNNYSLEQYIRRRQVSQSKSHSNCVTIRPTVVRQRISIRNCNISAWGVSWEMNTTRCPLDMHTEKPLAMALYPGQPWASPSSWCGKEQLCMQHLHEAAYRYQCRDQTCFWHLNYLNLKSILTLYIELNEHWTWLKCFVDCLTHVTSICIGTNNHYIRDEGRGHEMHCGLQKLVWCISIYM